jgi:hypothetical protein
LGLVLWQYSLKTRFSPRFGYCWKDTVAVRIPNHAATWYCWGIRLSISVLGANPLANKPNKCYKLLTILVITNGFRWGATSNGIESTIIGRKWRSCIISIRIYFCRRYWRRYWEKFKLKITMISHSSAAGMLSKHYAPTTTTFFKAM